MDFCFLYFFRIILLSGKEILVSAKTSELDKVKGLDIGADDYLCKPFGVMELISRVKALLRRSNVTSTIYICWGAQAGLYHHYGIQKHNLDEKIFGIFKNYKTTVAEPLLRGFDDIFPSPQSRHTEVRA